jgi:hypothetical protein
VVFLFDCFLVLKMTLHNFEALVELADEVGITFIHQSACFEGFGYLAD